MTSTQGVLEHHFKCFGVSDLKGILADYSPDVVMFSPSGLFAPSGVGKGLEAARHVFQTLFAEFGKPSARFEMKQLSIEGDYAYALWSAETPDNIYEIASDTFVVRDGRIVAQAFTGKILPKR